MPKKSKSGGSRKAKPEQTADPQPLHEIAPEDSPGTILVSQTLEYWESKEPEDRRHYLEQIRKIYLAIQKEFYKQADASTIQFQRFSVNNRVWRRAAITLTGGLAILNILITSSSDILRPAWGGLPLVAAIYAAVLAIISNLESFHKYPDRAQAFREVRELFLNGGRRFEMLWHTNVSSFQDDPRACLNASGLYAQITLRDEELRSQTKEIIEMAKSDAGVADHK